MVIWVSETTVRVEPDDESGAAITLGDPLQIASSEETTTASTPISTEEDRGRIATLRANIGDSFVDPCQRLSSKFANRPVTT
ncbi:hypothetical protein [Microlunatus elymi]|uniref:hypothetical protein n=1 Tax=Microlunatus elymi TaxID=2596828 RepID=UPI00143D03B5|nr:hypothetical protein [Microlunatus elymi]